MRLIIILMALALAQGSMAQKKPLLESQKEVEKQAIKEFETAMAAPEGSLYLFALENNIKGIYDFKITLGKRGKVISVFVISREGGDISSQNMFKDAVKAFKFNFKLPKNKNYSFKHKFIFNYKT
ncbi:MAG: hypothetical protein GXO88_02625 [Chlorobi bacterium]|nr:hypothetical protein [Chlorobiota bacterium]